MQTGIAIKVAFPSVVNFSMWLSLRYMACMNTEARSLIDVIRHASTYK